MVMIHYSVQVCDIANNQSNKRITGANKTDVSKRCLKSFFHSVKFLDVNSKTQDLKQTIVLFNDSSTPELTNFLYESKKIFENKNISIEIENLQTHGLRNSIEKTYDYLRTHGKGLVYQIQDDYLFQESTIYEMVDIYFQLKKDCDTEAIISPYNPPYIWNEEYKYITTPRVIIPGSKRYWIQTYDIACTFLTSINQFVYNWDIFEYFFTLLPHGIDSALESLSLNKMFTQKGILGLIPIQSLAFHLQSEREREPYYNWEQLWEKYKE
jgi:hypothetical protein